LIDGRSNSVSAGVRILQQGGNAIDAGVATVLAVLRSSAVVVDDSDEVVKSSAPAVALGLVRNQRLASAELAELVSQVRRDGQIREADLVLPQPNGPSRTVTARVAPLSSRRSAMQRATPSSTSTAPVR